MAGGIRIRDPVTGAILVTIDTRMTKILGSFNTGTTAGSVSDGNLTALPGAVPFFTTLPPQGSGGQDTPSISIAGNVISWSWKYSNAGGHAAVDVIYGFYV